MTGGRCPETRLILSKAIWADGKLRVGNAVKQAYIRKIPVARVIRSYLSSLLPLPIASMGKRRRF
jgi:hypothetical protein